MFICIPEAERSPHFHGTTLHGAIRIFRSGFQIRNTEGFRDTTDCKPGRSFFGVAEVADGYMCREPGREPLLCSCECIVTEMFRRAPNRESKKNKGRTITGSGSASRIYFREWDPKLGSPWTYQWDRMRRIYGPKIAEQVCGKVSMSGEISYLMDEEPLEEVRQAALESAPTGSLRLAST